MRVLVVGASSFTGRHFCEHASNKGADVIKASLRTWSLPKVMDVDYVVNFAALNVVAPSWQYPGAYMRVNVIETTRLLDWLLEQSIKKYVHISTPEVYGNVKGKITEAVPLQPSTPYAVSRAASEHMARCYHHQYGLPVVFTRGCNVYGPGQQLYRLIPKVMWSIKKGVRFPLEGGGTSHRAFVYVEDMCDAIWRVMLDGEAPYAYNVSAPYLFDIRSIVGMVAHKMGHSLDAIADHKPARPGQDPCYNLDVQAIRSLGWYDRTGIEEGLQQTLYWMNANWQMLKDQSTDYQVEL